MISRRAILLALSLASLSCGVSEAASTPDVTRHEITMRTNSFTPRDLAANVGDTIVWKNLDIVRHNAVRRDLFESGDLRRGESFSWIPADTGTYSYRCTIHSRMRGMLTVAPAP